MLSMYDISHGVWMTIQPRYLTTNSQYLCNHTHLIDYIKPCEYMQSHPLHVGRHRHYFWHNILSWTPHTIVCHGTHYVYDIISTIYDVTHTVCMKTQALYLIWNPFYLPTYPLYMSTHPLCRRHHTNYVRYHRCHMYDIICTVHDTYPPCKTTTLSPYDITSPLLMTSHALYMTCHLLFMISHSLYVWHPTMPVSLTSHTLCLWHIHFIWHHTQCYHNTTIV